MQIIKRNGTKEDVKLEKISKRIASHGKDLKNIDKILIAQKVVQGLYDGVTSKELDTLATETAYSMSVKHPDYDKLAIRLAVSSLHKETKSSFSEVMKDLYNVKDSNGNPKPLLSEVVYKFVVKNAHILDSAIDYSRDFLFDYFGFKTLDRSYLLKIDGKIVERPQHMWMRCAIGIHAYDKDIDGALNTYNMLSNLYATHATPTLFNAGLVNNQLASCFLIENKSDSISGIFDTMKEVALISKSAGGIGVHFHNIRSKDSPIFGTNGTSNGLIPFLKILESVCRAVDQGGNKRKGSAAAYIPAHHGDLLEFLDLRKNNGKEEMRARDLNLAIWAPDLFFKAVEEDSDWYLMDPNVSKGLEEVYDESENGTFTQLYNKYIIENKFVKKLKAREIWSAIITSQIETGQPYVLAKDACNRKSNQNNLGTIKSSNLCSEIIQYSSPEETAVCFTADTKVLTKNGYMNITDCDGEYILSPFESDSVFNKVNDYQKAKLISNGIKDVYEIQTSSGASIKATSNHLFLVRNKTKYNRKNKRIDFYQWKKLSDLDINDKISFETAPYDINTSFTKKEKDWLVAGWMMGDGWCSKKGWGVCFGPNEVNTSKIVIDHLSNIHQAFKVVGNGRDSKVKQYIQPNGVINWQSSKNNFKEYFQEKFGFKQILGKNKFLNSKILNSSKLELCSFLSGLFSADGTFGNYNGKAYVGLSSASKELLNTVCLALSSLGIRARFTFGPDKRKENKYQGHLNIYGINQLLMFKNMIGFDLSEKKQNLLNEYIENNVKVNNSLHNYHKVKSIKFLGKEEVFDLSLEKRHNFIANNMVVHNCNLASVSLTSFVEDKKGKKSFNFDKLQEVVKTLVENLNKVIDVSFYPVESAKKSNIAHRPMGIGVQGLANVFALMRMSWESPEALQLNADIAEAMYFSAMKTSCELAKKDGAYSSFKGSLTSKGILQFDAWNHKPSDKYDWFSLKEDIKKYGLRNSLLLTIMPTASTSQILGNTESVEMITSNIYKRSTLSGEFIQVNKYLVEDLLQLGLWNDTMRQKITAADGSIQNIKEIPDDIKMLYKTVWETSQRVIIDMAAARGPFICQSQSMNLYFKDANAAKISSALMYGWKKGLKTLVYYTRNTGATEAIKFTVDKKIENEMTEASSEELQEGIACSIDNPESCVMCSS